MNVKDLALAIETRQRANGCNQELASEISEFSNWNLCHAMPDLVPTQQHLIARGWCFQHGWFRHQRGFSGCDTCYDMKVKEKSP